MSNNLTSRYFRIKNTIILIGFDEQLYKCVESLHKYDVSKIHIILFKNDGSWYGMKLLKRFLRWKCEGISICIHSMGWDLNEDNFCLGFPKNVRVFMEKEPMYFGNQWNNITVDLDGAVTKMEMLVVPIQ